MTDPNQILRDALGALEKATQDSRKRTSQLEQDRKNLITSIGRDILGVLHPLLEKISENSKVNKEELKKAISEATINVDVQANTPVVNVPDVYVPEPKVTVNVPQIKIPDVVMPDEMNVKGWVSLMGVDLNNPLPVQLRDAKGNPVNLFENMTQIVNGGGGGGPKIIKVSGIDNSAWASLVNADGRLRVETNDSDSTRIVDQLSGANWTVNLPATSFVEQVSGSNWSVSVTGSSGTTIVIGADVSDAVDAGDAPVKIGGIARVANPTAVSAGGDRVSASFDDVGRLLTRPIQVRDLIQTAYIAKATGSTFGTETTLLAGATGVFLDLIYVMGTNDSDAAITVDLRAATAAGIIMSVRIPANGTAGVSLPVPLSQDVAADTWTLDLPDVTGTNVSISALFTKEV